MAARRTLDKQRARNLPVYDYFVSEYNDDGHTLTPLGINTFGNSSLSETGTMPFELNDAGDIAFSLVYGPHVLGAVKLHT